MTAIASIDRYYRLEILDKASLMENAVTAGIRIQYSDIRTIWALLTFISTADTLLRLNFVYRSSVNSTSLILRE